MGLHIMCRAIPRESGPLLPFLLLTWSATAASWASMRRALWPLRAHREDFFDPNVAEHEERVPEPAQ